MCDVLTHNLKTPKTRSSVVMPVVLVARCIKAGSRKGDVVLDAFCSAGTSGVASLRQGRGIVGLELLPEFEDAACKRISQPKKPTSEARWPLRRSWFLSEYLTEDTAVRFWRRKWR